MEGQLRSVYIIRMSGSVRVVIKMTRKRALPLFARADSGSFFIRPWKSDLSATARENWQADVSLLCNVMVW